MILYVKAARWGTVDVLYAIDMSWWTADHQAFHAWSRVLSDPRPR